MTEIELKKGWQERYVRWMYKHDLNFNDIAKRTGIKYQGVYRTLNAWTVHPQQKTVILLSEIAGDDWHMIAYGE